ncbi:MAG: pyridoxamine 5'-phosphate oxidase family protein [Treponema sp.]|jgi:uncharacterized pyridoxamine 5'-phosphate oxidase family protein|nr:pyridoxamine 5'-phosphate oxidase family protein [Treponema sp.]
MKEVLDFLREAGVFYFATVDGDQPMVRPFGFFMEFEGKLYFGTNKARNVYRQLQANPKFQACIAGKQMAWLRITGRVKFDNRPEVLEAAASIRPDLFGRQRTIHGAGNFKPALFYIEDGEAVFNTMPNVTRSVKL